MAKLTNIISLGRFKHNETKKCYNIKRGRNLGRGTEILFYLYRGTRVVISDREFHHDYKKVIPSII